MAKDSEKASRVTSRYYTITFFNTQAGPINVTKKSDYCMYLSGPDSFTLQPDVPKAIELEDKNSGGQCWNNLKNVVWTVDNGTKQITFRHEPSGNDWATMIEDLQYALKSAYCLTEGSENQQDCHNRWVDDEVVSTFVTF